MSRMLLVVVLLLSLMAGGCQSPVLRQDDGPWERTELMMDTVVRVVAYGPEDQCRTAIDAALAEMRRIESIFDVTDDSSELSRINRTFLGRPVRLSDDMVTVIQEAIHIAVLTDGAFDPTVGAVSGLWRGTGGEPPGDRELQSAVAHVGFMRLELDLQKQVIQMPTPGMRLDLGGIAKGYAVDRAAEILSNHDGVKAGMVVAGGSIRVVGKKPILPREWVVGVQHPRAPGEVIAELVIEEQAVDTSGDYHRFFMHDGVRYHHILDPRTGLPADSAISVTVIGTSAMTADALSTGLFVLGPERAIELVESMPGVEALIVDRDGRVITSSGCPARLTTREIDPEAMTGDPGS